MTPLDFDDLPSAREVSDVSANGLPAVYQGGSMSVVPGSEGDVAPRLQGNGSVTITDGVQIGRFAAGLDALAPGVEFQRADCAPRDTKGNGALSVADWTQAGRYAIGTDAIAAAGGPVVAAASAQLAAGGRRQAAGNGRLPRTPDDGEPAIRLARDAGDGFVVAIEARGGENAFGFSLNFDPAQWHGSRNPSPVVLRFARPDQLFAARRCRGGSGHRHGDERRRFDFHRRNPGRDGGAGPVHVNASGQGVVAAVALRIRDDGTQVFEPVSRFDAATGRFVPVQIDLGPQGEQVFLILFGTGFRNRSALAAATVKIGGLDVAVLFAGEASGFAGLDQCNVGPLPRSLAGRGEVEVALMVDGKTANAVGISVR